MIYHQFQDLQLSSLGVGTMRLPEHDGKIDVETTEKMIAQAMAAGVNYYDTAWGYHGGQSEIVVGAALKKYPRDSFYLATKFPGYDLANMDKVEAIFEEQLVKCGVDYFDFYLVHNVCEMNIEQYLDPQYCIYEYLTEQKRKGRIRHLGFSAHGDVPVIRRFLQVYGKDMEFGQIELNWFDWNFQDAKGKAELLQEWNLPIWVMEPVRGGQLANLTDDAAVRLKALRPDESIAAWSFRFLQGIKGVTVTLSGMSSMAQMQENIAVFGENKPLNTAETETLLSIADEMVRKTTVPCTACRYCVTHCPMGLPIPDLLKLYNESMVSGSGVFIAPMALAAIPRGKRAVDCIGCGSCAAVCPQQISIPEALADFAAKVSPRE